MIRPFYNSSSALNDNNYVVTIFMQSFETTDCSQLIKKLRKYGVSDCVLNWVKSYLSNRYQHTKMQGKEPEELPIEIGVPRGSVLGHELYK